MMRAAAQACPHSDTGCPEAHLSRFGWPLGIFPMSSPGRRCLRLRLALLLVTALLAAGAPPVWSLHRRHLTQNEANTPTPPQPSPPQPPSQRALSSDAPTGLEASLAVLNPKPCWFQLQYHADVGYPRNRSDGRQNLTFKAYWRLTPLGNAAFTYKPFVAPFQSWALGWNFAAGEQIEYGNDGDGQSVFGDETDRPGDTMPAKVIAMILSNHTRGGSIVRGYQSVAILSNSTLKSSINGSPLALTLAAEKGPATAVDADADSSAIGSGTAAPQSAAAVFLDGPSFAPLRVAAPENVFLNNLVCSQAQEVGDSARSLREAAATQNKTGSSRMPPPPPSPPPLVQTANSSPANASGTLQVSYASIDVLITAASGVSVAGGDATAVVPVFTPVPVTLLNITLVNEGDGAEGIPLQNIEIEYWFQGPNVTTADDSAPPSFTIKCWATNPALRSGCGEVNGTFRHGYPEVPGARYVLTLGFTTEPMYLMPPRDYFANEQMRYQTYYYVNDTRIEVGVVQMIVSIQSTDAMAQLDARQDYSYSGTPLSWTMPEVPGYADARAAAAYAIVADVAPAKAVNSTFLVSRQVEPNPRMPAYVAAVGANRTLQWGSPPDNATAAATAPSPAFDQQQPQALRQDEELADLLPPGSSCNWQADGSLRCQLDAMYCCVTSSTTVNLVMDLPPDTLNAVAEAVAAAAAVTTP